MSIVVGLGLSSMAAEPAWAADEPAQGKVAVQGEYVEGGYGAGADRSKLKDSFKYYGPGGLWYRWTDDQKLGRDTWFFYTGGTQKFYRILATFGGQNGISVDFFRLLATNPDARFRKIGLMNEPNFEGKVEDEYGFLVDKSKGDPIPGAYPTDPKLYGEPTGIIGLRKFPNPAFTEAMGNAWKRDKKASVKTYFANPGKVEPPYLVGITCALCHVAFDPLNPPADPVKPRWENLAANMGNQYFREGDLFFGAGRIVGGDANPGKNYPDDPYDTKGLDASSFLYQYGHTQQPGTSETSRFSYDFINNPNTINQIFYVGNRAGFCETTPTGVKLITNHVLKDGADSVGILAALLRVYINIGSEGDYWADRLWNPATGATQKPFAIEEVRQAAGLVATTDDRTRRRKEELLRNYPELGQHWRESERRVPFLASYLSSYTPYKLADVKGADGKPKYITKNPAQLARGAVVFAETCATCHSNKQPFYPLMSEDDRKRFFRGLVPSDQFQPGNTLSDDVRYPFNYPNLEVNAARALATNAVDGDIWAEFSSKDYKALPPLGYMTFKNPLGPSGQPIETEFVAPGGGRGYYRTAALNSMWATAPYLHNNSVGRDPLDKNDEIDPAALTVEGRLALFEEAMDQLLNPWTRRPKVKVTSADSSLTAGFPALEKQVASMLAAVAKQAVEETLHDVGLEAVANSDLPAEFKPLLKTVLDELEAKIQPEIDKFYTLENLDELKREVTIKVEAQIKAVVDEKLKDKPRVAQLIAPLRSKFEEALQARSANLAELLRSRFVIAKGTPVNLLLNLHIGKVPYALKAYLKYKRDPGKLASELLRLSDCPDLVENHGHTFGSDLRPEDKRALIEYLKTF
jgi:hypothetical protein